MIEKYMLKFKKIYNKETPLKLEWFVAILIALVVLIMFTYIDLKSLTIWSTNILDCIADGNITNYFKFTSLNLHNAPHGYVSGTLYSLIPWAIWNVPIWLFQRYLGIDILINSLSLIWSKLFLVLALAITLYYTYKLVQHLTNDKISAKWTIFLSFTYIYTYIGVFYVGQNDILICMLGIMSIYYLITQKSKNILFYILAGFAISVKYFFFMPYLILVLFLEKDIIKIGLKLFVGILPTLIFNLICRNLPMFLESSSQNANSSILNRIIGSSFPILSGYSLSLFIFSFIILAFIAYKTVANNTKERNEYIIYFTTATFILLLAFTAQEFYRMILLMPFIFIMFSLNKPNLRINLILETVICLTFVLSQCTNSYNFFASHGGIENALLTNILNLNLSENVSPYFFLIYHFPNFTPILGRVCSTVAFSGFMLILAINYPRKKINIDFKNDKCERYIIWFRTLIIVPIILYLLISCIR